ncbi:hypothetical protein [Candidatus Amarolinea aalborgensis]|uniref:hypothetical protein n=1 Tax=Candidatus Amarolinea aalborgensis TaxID=2249329 RepID=UPI003BF9DF1F
MLQAIGDVQQFSCRHGGSVGVVRAGARPVPPGGLPLSEANVLQAIGDVQQFVTTARSVASYGQALGSYRQVETWPGEANAPGHRRRSSNFPPTWRERWRRTGRRSVSFRQVGSRLGEANVLWAIGDVQQFRKEMAGALASYGQALERSAGGTAGRGQRVQAIGDVQQFRADMAGALASYGQALEPVPPVGDRLGEANVPRPSATCSNFVTTAGALASYGQALDCTRQWATGWARPTC